MSEDKGAQKPLLTYKGRPLMRHDNIIYYGSMSDKYIIIMQVLETKTVKGLPLSTKVAVQLQQTGQGMRGKDKIVKKTEKNGLYTAMDVAAIWLERALSAK